MVQINTAFLPGADAAVLRIKGSKKALAMTLDGNALYTRLDPRTGARIAVAEACRNLACVGARPIGVTNCLNFGNPEKPEVMGSSSRPSTGLAEACRAFEIPVTGGNVSFYNDTEGRSIHPTPVLGIVGIIEDIRKAVRPGFAAAGDAVVLIGETPGRARRHGISQAHPRPRSRGAARDRPRAGEARSGVPASRLIDAGLLRSAHDLSEGGLAVALTEGRVPEPASISAARSTSRTISGPTPSCSGSRSPASSSLAGRRTSPDS